MDRYWSNERIINRVNEILESEETNTRIKLLSETIKERKVKLLGHILRADDSDQVKMAAIDLESMQAHVKIRKRVGKPRI